MATGCVAGYIWLFFVNLWPDRAMGVCLFKRIYGIPCPACGSTRAISELIRGNPVGSLEINPNGVVLASIMLVLPVWLLWDVCTKSDSLFRFYGWFEQKLKRRWVWGIFCFFVLLNWVWNIYKGV